MKSSATSPTTHKTTTKRILADQPCLVCGAPDCEPAHYPVRQGQGGGWGLLEVIPLCRMHHRLLDDYVEPWSGDIIPMLADDFHQRMYLRYRDSSVYLGPPERVEEVEWNAKMWTC